MKRVALFVDETGKPPLTHTSPYFILSGCIIPIEHVDEIRQKADSIIFKYWGSQRSYSVIHHTNHRIVFHAVDIFLCNGVFTILSDAERKRNFWNDVYGQLLSRRDIVYLIILIDKRAVGRLPHPWTSAYLLERAYGELLGAFINYLRRSHSVGEIVAESSHDQDIALINSLSYYQRNSSTLYRDAHLVNEKITSLSFVNKNHDNIGAQIADLMAWTGSNKYEVDNGTKIITTLRHEERRLLDMFNKRLASRRAPGIYNNFAAIDH